MAQDASSSTARATARLPHASGRPRFRDRAGVLARFVAELDPEEERLLAELLDRSAHPAS